MITSLYLMMIAHTICKSPSAAGHTKNVHQPHHVPPALVHHDNNNLPQLQNNNAGLGWGDVVANGDGALGFYAARRGGAAAAGGAAVAGGGGDAGKTGAETDEKFSEREMRLHTAVYRYQQMRHTHSFVMHDSVQVPANETPAFFRDTRQCTGTSQ